MAKPGVNVEDLDNDLRSKTIRYRGHVYTLSELPYVDYQKTVKQATTRDELTKEDVYDGDAHNAILIGKSVKIDGKRTSADVIYESGTGLVRQILRDLQSLNFDEEKGEEPEAGDDDQGEAVTASSSATAS